MPVSESLQSQAEEIGRIADAKGLGVAAHTLRESENPIGLASEIIARYTIGRARGMKRALWLLAIGSIGTSLILTWYLGSLSFLAINPGLLVGCGLAWYFEIAKNVRSDRYRDLAFEAAAMGLSRMELPVTAGPLARFAVSPAHSLTIVTRAGVIDALKTKLPILTPDDVYRFTLDQRDAVIELFRKSTVFVRTDATDCNGIAEDSWSVAVALGIMHSSRLFPDERLAELVSSVQRSLSKNEHAQTLRAAAVECLPALRAAIVARNEQKSASENLLRPSDSHVDDQSMLVRSARFAGNPETSDLLVPIENKTSSSGV